MSKNKPLDFENLRITVRDFRGQEYVFPKKKMIDMLKEKGILELLEVTNKVEFEIDGILFITVEVDKK